MSSKEICKSKEECGSEGYNYCNRSALHDTRTLMTVAQQQVPGWKLVPVEPTPEMVIAAEEAHMPFGDMDIALRMAILSAPSAPAAVQEGYVLVPVEPTQEMLAAGLDRHRPQTMGGERLALLYRAMLAARKGEGK